MKNRIIVGIIVLTMIVSGCIGDESSGNVDQEKDIQDEFIFINKTMNYTSTLVSEGSYPSIIQSKDGDLILIYNSPDGLAISKSIDGQNWNKVDLSPNNSSFMAEGVYPKLFEMQNGTFVLSFLGYNSDMDGLERFVSFSSDLKSWSDPIISEYYIDIIQLENGNFMIAQITKSDHRTRIMISEDLLNWTLLSEEEFYGLKILETSNDEILLYGNVNHENKTGKFYHSQNGIDWNEVSNFSYPMHDLCSTNSEDIIVVYSDIESIGDYIPPSLISKGFYLRKSQGYFNWSKWIKIVDKDCFMPSIIQLQNGDFILAYHDNEGIKIVTYNDGIFE